MQRKVAITVFLSLALIWLLSWQSQTYVEYCKADDDCAHYNLLPLLFVVATDFFERYESTFVALGTVAIAWFTYQLRSATVGLKDSTDRLWEAGEKQIALVGGQLDLAEKEHGLAREEYFASHRPRIAIHSMSAELRAGSPIRTKLAYINSGEAKATRSHWTVGILLLNGAGAIHGNYTYENSQSGWDETPLHVGTSTLITFADKIPLDLRDLEDIESGRKVLHVIGTIISEDTLGTQRTMGFFRWYDIDNRRFRVVDDPEYEFHD